MNNTNDTSFIHTFTLLIIGLTVTGILAFVLAQLVAKTAEDDQVTSKNVIERTQPIGRHNTTGDQVIVTSIPGLLPESLGEESLEASIASQIALKEAPETNTLAVAEKNGEQVYNSACAVCHGAGVAGAPRFGDSGAWETRVAKGDEKLYANAINGYIGKAGVMPAKGGRPDLTDKEVEKAVDYMTQSSL